jgi:AraC-like DNA-binding protein
MLRRTVLLDDEGLRLEDIRCASGRGGWSAPEPCNGCGVVFVRRGCFRRRVEGVESLLDPSVVYFEAPGAEQQVAHPHDGGDACTVFALSAEVAAELWGGDADLPTQPLYSDPVLDLQHRQLVASAGCTDAFELGERSVLVLARLLERAEPARVAAGRPSTVAARRRAVEATRELLAGKPCLSLLGLAREVAVSPHHLSRTFSHATGSSITRYRNRLRVRLALERIAEGETSLARLAAELGFADHAHMTRVVRAELGEPPAQLRDALTPREATPHKLLTSSGASFDHARVYRGETRNRPMEV